MKRINIEKTNKETSFYNIKGGELFIMNDNLCIRLENDINYCGYCYNIVELATGKLDYIPNSNKVYKVNVKN